MGAPYATREQVMRSLEMSNTSRSRRVVDDKLYASSRSIEGQTHRRFYPELKTVKFDWPNYSMAPTWQLQLDGNELISVASLSAGGTAITADQFFLRRYDDRDEPPYNLLEIDLSGSSAFSGGNTFQRSIAITGTFGWNDTATATAAALLATSVNSSLPTLVLKPTAGAFNVGVGSLLMMGTERLLVIGRFMSDTAVNTASALTAKQSDESFTVADGTLFAEDEIIMIDTERMRISDIAGNTIIVERGSDGSTLSTHTSGADIYAQRTFRVVRGALGSTAAGHTAADSVYAHAYPDLINEWCVAETVVLLEQNASGYARTIGSGDNMREAGGRGLADIREQAMTLYGRRNRSGAI